MHEGDRSWVMIYGSGDYYVSVIDYAAAAALGVQITAPQKGVNRVWHIYGDPANTVYLIHDTLNNGAVYDDQNAFITRYEGNGNWSNTGNTNFESDGSHSSNYIGSTMASSPSSNGAWLSKTSDITMPLPVKLVGFDVYKKENFAELSWATTSEQNNKGFAIERSMDGSSWTQIGFVNSLSESGNSNTRSDYSFMDNKPADGRNFYRLKQTDFEGKYTFSKLVSILFDQADRVTIYPNPVTKYIHINGIQYGASIALYDVSGRLLQQQQAIKDKVDIDMENLNSGIYIINITATDGSTTQYKVVKQP